MTTYHDKNGRFTSKAGATTAVRDGERLKVVRQLRRLHRSAKKESSHDRVMRTVLQSNLAKAKAGLIGELTAPGFVNVHDVLFQGR